MSSALLLSLCKNRVAINLREIIDYPWFLPIPVSQSVATRAVNQGVVNSERIFANILSDDNWCGKAMNHMSR